ncbi:acyltransferase [uncultured Sunxiuqinia sp.]|uniref:acyltransferase n=1 Tax=uncultured Sunxiuqinia sp. TaxID=1573825 RepID=UPI002AA715E1|nr:acyltransferase [uncultured Sunxiuqinia sp.]
MKKIKLFFYYLACSKMPSSWWPGGKIFNNLRIFCLKGIVTIGEGTRIQKGVYFGKGNDISIGRKCQINEMVRLDNVSIGDNVMIARECIVLGKVHEMSKIDIPMSEQGRFVPDATIIEDDVWLGLRVVVLPGVIIAEGSVVGAGAVVSKNTEPFGIYGGVPAKLIRYRNKYE